MLAKRVSASSAENRYLLVLVSYSKKLLNWKAENNVQHPLGKIKYTKQQSPSFLANASFVNVSHCVLQ